MKQDNYAAQPSTVDRREFLRAASGAAAIVGGLSIGAIPGVARANEAPIWIDIPNQSWTIGVPVFLDLRDYCSDPDGDNLTFTINTPLPDGVTLDGSIIRGTPQSVFPAMDFVATADDDVISPNSPTDLAVT